MAMEKAGTCWNCGNELTEYEYKRGDSCSKCGRDTRACRGCIFYDRSYNNECRESEADRVLDKEKANFCDYFKPSSTKKSEEQKKSDLRTAANALFKKK